MTLDLRAGASLPRTAATLRTAGSPVKGPERIPARLLPDISPPAIDSRTALSALSALSTQPRDLSPFIQGTLAISFGGAVDLVPGSRAPDPKSFSPRHAFAGDLPEPKKWVRHMAQALIEVMSGARPAPQVIRWTTPEVYSAVARRNAVARGRTVAARRAIVRQVLICEPATGVIEACAVVVDNGRVRALAMRLSCVDRRWVVSDLQVG